MKKLLIAVSLFMIINGAKSQKTADVGIWGGTGTSFGDMTQTDLGSSLGFNYGAFVRYNFNPRVSARLQLMNGSIKGEGEFDSNPWVFGPKNMTSLSLMGEVNFFKYLLGRKETPFTTYLLGGIGIGMYPYDCNYMRMKLGVRRYNMFLERIDDDYVALDPVVGYLDDLVIVIDERLDENYSENIMALQIPFGFGVKFNLNEKMGIGFELLVNRYFSDKIDNLDDPRKYYTVEMPPSVDVDGVRTPGVYQLQGFNDKWHNNDYTAYLGLHLTYKINLSKKACPVYEYE
ncbi:MAG: DUF6089 family protein [Prolixibacteraceae bacterium]|jgi:hypothetical protein|nr:DUF6089 family protein [Prolixibacteraceae bacterium]